MRKWDPQLSQVRRDPGVAWIRGLGWAQSGQSMWLAWARVFMSGLEASLMPDRVDFLS